MIARTLALATTLALALPAAALAQEATATLRDVSGAAVGKASFRQTPNGVLISAEAKGISPGEHAFHVHETGRCDADRKFESAGGHFAMGKEHGFEVAGGPHPGDMPNVHVGDDGVFRTEVLNPHISLEQGADGYLFDDDGSALVIHAGADDYRSQPSGAAGDRVACGVIEQ